MISADCLSQVLEDVEAKAEKFPLKQLRIVKGLGQLVIKPTDNSTQYKLPKVTQNTSVKETDIILKCGEKIPLFTFTSVKESTWQIGPRYFISESCYIQPMATNTLRTMQGRMLLKLFIKQGRNTNSEHYVLNYGEMADAFSLPRNSKVLFWLFSAARNLFCGAKIVVLKGDWGGINYAGSYKITKSMKEWADSYYESEATKLPVNIWDWDFELYIGTSLFYAMQTWFIVPDIPVEIWRRFKSSKPDLLTEIYQKHLNNKHAQKQNFL